MIHTHKLAVENKLTRRLINISKLDKENLWKCQVEIAGELRSELTYIFVEGSADMSQACLAAVDRATELFLGVQPVVASSTAAQVEQHISKQEEKHEEDSKQEASDKSESKPVEGKKPRQSRSKKEQVKTEAPKEEQMEEVESPFKKDEKEYEKFDKDSKELKAFLATLLTKLHKDAHPSTDGKQWKIRTDLKEISAHLHGRAFINQKTGTIHPDFEAECKVKFELEENDL